MSAQSLPYFAAQFWPGMRGSGRERGQFFDWRLGARAIGYRAQEAPMARLLAACSGFVVMAVLITPAFAQTSEQAWRSLSDGKTMTGWTTVGGVKWTVADGAFTANPSLQTKEPLQGFLRTTEEFGDFDLRAEF